jgi:hypothetical protein
MTRQVPTFAAIVSVALVALVWSLTPGTASAQRYETDHEFERKTLSEIRSVRRRIQKFREELMGDSPAEPGRRGTGHYPGVISRLEGLEKRCDFQEDYVRRMGPSSMRTEQQVYYERQAVLEDIRNVRAEIGRIKRDMQRIDEETEKADRERAEREALEEEIMKEEW